MMEILCFAKSLHGKGRTPFLKIAAISADERCATRMTQKAYFPHRHYFIPLRY